MLGRLTNTIHQLFSPMMDDNYEEVFKVALQNINDLSIPYQVTNLQSHLENTDFRVALFKRISQTSIDELLSIQNHHNQLGANYEPHLNDTLNRALATLILNPNYPLSLDQFISLFSNQALHETLLLRLNHCHLDTLTLLEQKGVTLFNPQHFFLIHIRNLIKQLVIFTQYNASCSTLTYLYEANFCRKEIENRLAQHSLEELYQLQQPGKNAFQDTLHSTLNNRAQLLMNELAQHFALQAFIYDADRRDCFPVTRQILGDELISSLMKQMYHEPTKFKAVLEKILSLNKGQYQFKGFCMLSRLKRAYDLIKQNSHPQAIVGTTDQIIQHAIQEDADYFLNPLIPYFSGEKSILSANVSKHDATFATSLFRQLLELSLYKKMASEIKECQLTPYAQYCSNNQVFALYNTKINHHAAEFNFIYTKIFFAIEEEYKRLLKAHRGFFSNNGYLKAMTLNKALHALTHCVADFISKEHETVDTLNSNLKNVLTELSKEKLLKKSRNPYADFFRGLLGVFLALPTLGLITISSRFRNTFFAVKSQLFLEKTVKEFAADKISPPPYFYENENIEQQNSIASPQN